MFTVVGDWAIGVLRPWLRYGPTQQSKFHALLGNVVCAEGLAVRPSSVQGPIQTLDARGRASIKFASTSARFRSGCMRPPGKTHRVVNCVGLVGAVGSNLIFAHKQRQPNLVNVLAVGQHSRPTCGKEGHRDGRDEHSDNNSRSHEANAKDLGNSHPVPSLLASAAQPDFHFHVFPSSSLAFSWDGLVRNARPRIRPPIHPQGRISNIGTSLRKF